MWLWEVELRALGFKRRSERYWQCERRFGLREGEHLSIFSWGEQGLPAGRFLVELTEFHVTREVGPENLHFYYHERSDNEWEPGGHTSGPELRRLGHDPGDLRRAADAVAAAFVASLAGTYRQRDE